MVHGWSVESEGLIAHVKEAGVLFFFFKKKKKKEAGVCPTEK